MSILLVDPPRGLGEVVARVLIEEGDQVRVVVRDAAAATRWRDVGAHVASGDPRDADLIERAAVNVRTLVLLDWEGDRAANTDLVVEAAERARVGRVVVTTRKPIRRIAEVLEHGSLDFVHLVVGGRLPRARVSAEQIAIAVSAADDLAGNPRMTVDLTSEAGWANLNLPT